MAPFAQLQSGRATQPRGTARLPLEMTSKRRPTWDKEVIRSRMVTARLNKKLEVKEAAAAAGMNTHWNWYSKEEKDGPAFQVEQCLAFAEAIGAPTLWPFFDWDFADDIDDRLGWKK